MWKGINSASTFHRCEFCYLFAYLVDVFGSVNLLSISLQVAEVTILELSGDETWKL